MLLVGRDDLVVGPEASPAITRPRPSLVDVVSAISSGSAWTISA